MEDSVPWSEKRSAREVTSSSLAGLAGTGIAVVPRLNSLDTGLFEEDLAAVIGPHISAVTVGKVQSRDDMERATRLIDRYETNAGLPAGRIGLIPWLETARAIVSAYEICTSSSRTAAVAFGAEDFTNDMGIERRADEADVAYARSAVAVAARAAGVLALDTPFFGFRDPEGLRQSSERSKGYGYQGRFAIHPSQIEIITETYAPSEAEVENALRVVAAFEEAERQGHGATSLDGQVIDVPVVRRAQKLLEAAGRSSPASS
jgi:citrate lyase subunit beta/citryl-CoA lyase